MKQLILGILLISTFAFGTRHTFAQCDCIGTSKDIRGTIYSTAYEELKNADENVENDFKEFEKNREKQTRIIKASSK